MKLIKRLMAAISMYSRVPVPVSRLDGEDYKGCILFLPVIGLIIGGLDLAWFYCTQHVLLPVLAVSAGYALIPILVTGGFHLDGYMDTVDAIRSYKSREEKLKIMKDPHTGAFAIIALCTHILIVLGAASAISFKAELRQITAFALIYVTSRAVTGLTSVIMKKAKSDGMLCEETRETDSGTVTGLGIVLAVSLVLTGVLSLPVLAAHLITVAVCTMYYKSLCEKSFGGVTGDTAGYLLILTETVGTLLTAVALNLN